MTNNGKLSKVMLLAGALIFASFHSFPVRAEDNGVTLGEVVSTAVGAYPDIIDVTTASGRLQEEQYKNKKAYEEAQKKYYAALAEAQKEVQEEKAKCDRDPNDCQAYDAARRNLQALQSDDNEMKKAVDAAREKVQETSDQIKKQTREAEDAVYEARKDENKNLKNAEKDIEKYCGDGKNADATKCADARQRKANAERALQQIDVSENAVSGQSLLTQQAINERDQQYNENEEKIADLEKEIDELDPSDPSYARKKAELEAQKQELEIYNKGVEQAKRKEGLLGGSQSNAELAADMAEKQNDYAAAKEGYTKAAEELAKTNAACAKGDADACAQKAAKEQALADARAKADAAYIEKVSAESAASGVSKTDQATAKKDTAAAAADEAATAVTNAQTNLKQKQEEQKTACKDANSDACKKAKEAVEEAQQELSNAEAQKKSADQALSKAEKEVGQAKVSDAKEKVKDLEKEVEAQTENYNNLKAQRDEAQQACEYSSKLTSTAGRADAEKYCAQAAQLDQQVAEAEAALEEKEKEKAEAEAEANALESQYGSEGADHTGQVYQAFSTAKNDLFSGQYVGGGDFSNTSDIFQTMTRRAMRILVGLKPIVYTFAGFGLIGFAFMAVFNKINWKWFANIAIGLFLVANIGRFIEYFVYPNIGEEVARQKLSFGDYLSAGFADTEYIWVDEISAYMPPKVIGEGEIPDVGINVPESETNAR